MNKKFTALVASGTLAAATAAALLAGGASNAAAPIPVPALTLSASLTKQAPENTQIALTGQSVSAEVARQAAAIPLPPGGTFNGINWNATFTPNQIAGQLQYNAACQWWRAAANGDAQATSIAQAIPAWPVFRTDTDGALRATAENAANPAASRDSFDVVVANCNALHDYLVTEAAQLGEAPPQ